MKMHMKKIKKSPPLRTTMLFVSMLLILQVPFHAIAQQKTVKGHIANENGQPLQGASVIVKGTSKGTSTDVNGNFSIEVGPVSTIIISSVGYTDQQIPVGKRLNFDIKLVNVNKDLG